ncbi:MAG: FecR family protein [Gemmatimonadales bacterium]
MTPHDDPPEQPPEAWDVDALWARVRERTVDAANDRTEAPMVSHRGRRVAPWVYAYAAGLVVCAIAGAWIVRSRDRIATPRAAAAPGDYRTSRGQYATVRLADSTVVTIAPESHLAVSARFGEGVRELSLEGEAIFSVRHDASHPFRVHARNALIEDIGTKFDVRAYSGDATVTVAVVEGSVAITRDQADSGTTQEPQRPRLALAGGTVGTLDRRGRVLSVRAPDVARYLGWASGHLSFVDRPLPDVLATIGRWYDLDIRVSDARLAERRVNAEFSTQSPSEMLDALAAAVGARVERAGRVVTLRAR